MEAWSRIRLGMLAVVLATSCGTRALTKDGGSVDGDAGGATGRYRQAPAAAARPRVAAPGSPVSRVVGKTAGAASPVRPAAARWDWAALSGPAVSAAAEASTAAGRLSGPWRRDWHRRHHRDGRCRGRRRNRGPGRIQRHRGKRARRRVGRERPGRQCPASAARRAGRRRRQRDVRNRWRRRGGTWHRRYRPRRQRRSAAVAAAAAAESAARPAPAGCGGSRGRGGSRRHRRRRLPHLQRDDVADRRRDIAYNAARKRALRQRRRRRRRVPEQDRRHRPVDVVRRLAIPIGSDPRALALSDDGATLWVGIDGAHAFRKVTMGSTPPVVGPLIHLPKAMPRRLLRRVRDGRAARRAAVRWRWRCPTANYGRGPRVR